MKVTATDDRAALLDAMETQVNTESNERLNEPISEPNQPVIDGPTQSCFSGNKWTLFSAIVNCLVTTMIGGSASVTLWFAFKARPISAFHLHIGLSAIGYQLLIAHGILFMRSSGWSAITHEHRRRLHWIMQLVGSVFAIAGSAIMINEKSVHFNSLHGKFALAALIFTCASLVNGMTSLYATELRRFISPRFSKISHILLGTASFALSSVALAFGYYKKSFKEWASEEFAVVMICVVAVYTFIVPPCFAFLRKTQLVFKAKIC